MHQKKPILVTGAAGGVRIIMGVVHAVLNTIDFKMDIAHAVDAERMDAVRGLPMEIEDVRVSPADQAELERRGHQLLRQGEYAIRPRVQAAGTNLKTDRNEAVSDPRTVWGSLGQ